MRTKIGITCMVLGAAMILAALGLFLYNESEAAAADEAAADRLSQIVDTIDQRQESGEAQPPDVSNVPLEFLTPEDLEMTVVEINGYGYIGYLTIPSLQLELPVMADWDYPRLKIAPCRMAGTLRGEDLVLMAHNYDRHFGRLSKLKVGDNVVFTDMDGVVTVYEVVGQDILAPTAVEEMTAGDFDLTLFTCTYGGKSRVTVYCDIIKN